MTIREAFLFGREHLAASGSAEPEIEAEMLLRHALRLDRAGLFTRWEQAISAEFWRQYRDLLESRASGRPVHYIIGEREFMGLPFTVDERVMVPRPETEILVEYLIAECRARAAGSGHRAPDTSRVSSFAARSPKPEARQFVIVDVGTGSGCIAVSLAVHLPHATVYATEIAPAALTVARVNARRHAVTDRITFLEGDLLSPLPAAVAGQVDAVVSNPPYVPQAEATTLPREVRDFEPASALLAPHDGTEFHRRLIAESPRWLRAGGLLIMEVGPAQAQTVTTVVRADGRFAYVRTHQDLAGMERVVIGGRR